MPADMPGPAAGEAQPRKRKRPQANSADDPDRTPADPGRQAATGRRAGTRRAGAAGRWPVPTARARTWSVRYALLAYAVTAAVGLSFPTVCHFALGVEVPVGFSALFVELTLLCALIPLHRAGRLSTRDLGFRAAPGARAVGLCLLALAAYFAFNVAYFNALGQPPIGNIFAGIADRSTLVIVVTAFTAAVGAPVAEEVFFRGLLYRSLRNRLGPLPAASAAAVLFALVHAGHYPLAALPGVACFGVVACLLYERTGSLLPGIAVHSFVDASAFEATLTGRITVTFDAFVVLALGLLARAGIRTLRGRSARRALPVG
jgi:membrane protease YdiL (CAAX protease family)